MTTNELDPAWAVRNLMLRQPGLLGTFFDKHSPIPSTIPPVSQVSPESEAVWSEEPAVQENLQGGSSFRGATVTRVVVARTPLFDAVALGDVALVQRLLQSGTFDDDFDAAVEEWCDYLYVPPLWVAVVNRDVGCAAALLEKAADVNCRVQKCGHVTRQYYASTTRTALAHAGAVGDEAMVRLLMKYGADPDIECLEEDFNGFSVGQPPDSRTYVAKDCCKVGMHYLSALIDDYSQQRVAALQDFMAPALEDEEDDDTGGMFLTHRLAKQLLEELVKAGKSSGREEVLQQWGFGSPGEAEAALKVAIENDHSGKLQELKDLWLSRLMRNR